MSITRSVMATEETSARARERDSLGSEGLFFLLGASSLRVKRGPAIHGTVASSGTADPVRS
jgi:hypothetical protein